MTDVIETQRAALRILYRAHVKHGEHYALLDFPDHANVGDSAIWLGEIAMLRSVTGRDPDYVCTHDGFDAGAFRRACPDGVVFLHGGGNLGDIWPHHQRFRERMLAELRDRTVVQLPQSIHFRSPDGISRFGDAAAAHPNFYLHVRDRPSLAFAQAHWTCPVGLAPDSAFAMGPQFRGVPDCDLLMLMRTDDERVRYDRSALAAIPGAVVCDWLDDDVLPVAEGTQVEHCHALATARVRRGLLLLTRGRRIVTDRLHAHILALLLDIPHVALDNDYGKLSAYIAAWTHASPRVRFAASAAAL